jgi:hypothetical protein
MLLLIGTAGLLLNEFAFGWGRLATLIFAALNTLGLVQLIVTYKKDQVAHRQKSNNLQ